MAPELQVFVSSLEISAKRAHPVNPVEQQVHTNRAYQNVNCKTEYPKCDWLNVCMKYVSPYMLIRTRNTL